MAHRQTRPHPVPGERPRGTRRRGGEGAEPGEVGTGRPRPEGWLAEGGVPLPRFEPTEEGFIPLYDAPVLTRIEWVKRGVGAGDAKAILSRFHVAQGAALTALQIPVATMNRKARTNEPLAPAEGERVLGLGRLLGQVQAMVRESGNPEGFDASAWLSEWISTPVPALGGARPLDLMDTMTGQGLVSQVLAQMQGGAYA